MFKICKFFALSTISYCLLTIIYKVREYAYSSVTLYQRLYPRYLRQTLTFKQLFSDRQRCCTIYSMQVASRLPDVCTVPLCSLIDHALRSRSKQKVTDSSAVTGKDFSFLSKTCLGSLFIQEPLQEYIQDFCTKRQQTIRYVPVFQFY